MYNYRSIGTNLKKCKKNEFRPLPRLEENSILPGYINNIRTVEGIIKRNDN